jgi:hypothetical protein
MRAFKEQILADEPRIESLTPQPFSDGRRVGLTLQVSGLAAYGPGTGPQFLDFGNPPEAGTEPQSPNVELFPEGLQPDREPSETWPSPGSERRSSPFPDIRLSILDPYGNEMVATYIVEHKEPELDFTLHVKGMEPGASYVARAEMTKDDQVLQAVEVAFNYPGERISYG